jgi:hypothetical protein
MWRFIDQQLVYRRFTVFVLYIYVWIQITCWRTQGYYFALGLRQHQGAGPQPKPRPPPPRPARSQVTVDQSCTNRRIAWHWSWSWAGGRRALASSERLFHETSTTPLLLPLLCVVSTASRSQADTNQTLHDTFVLEPGLTFSLSEMDNFVHRFYTKYNNVYSLMFSYCKCQFMLYLLAGPNEVTDSFTVLPILIWLETSLINSVRTANDNQI